MDLACIFSVLLATKIIVDCGLVQSWMLSASTVLLKVQASTCLKHTSHACMHKRKPNPNNQQSYYALDIIRIVLDLQLANRAWPRQVDDSEHLHKGCQRPAAHTVFSPATLTASATCTDTVPSHAKNGSGCNSREGWHMIDEMEQAGAVALMDAQVCTSL